MKQIPPHIFWPGAVVLLLLMSLTLVTITVVAAVDDPSFAVEPDYYKEHIDWNARKERQRKSDALGWIVTIAVEPKPDASELPRVDIAIFDKTGKPIEKAEVSAEVFHHARAHIREPLTFSRAQEPGHYQAAAHIDRDGIWEFDITIHAGDATYVNAIKGTLTGFVWVRAGE